MPGSHSISWADPALADLLELLRYFEEQKEPEVGKELVGKIYRAAEKLATFPHAGRQGLVPDTRELVLPHIPYFLVYRMKDGTVDVLRVMHTSRLWRG